MKTKKKIRVIIILSILTIPFSSLFAQELSGISASFVDLGFGTRAAGMGNAFIASSNDASAVFWNPGGMLFSNSSSAEFNYLKQLQLVSYSSFSAVFPLGKNYGSLGTGFIFSGDDAMKEFTVILGYAKRFGDFNLGLNIKYRYATFGNNSFDSGDYFVFDQDEIYQGESIQVFGNGQGFGLDFGLIYVLNKNLNLGFVVKDFIAPFNWNSDTKSETEKPRGNYSEPMPIKVYLGVSSHPFPNLEINADFKPAFLNQESNIFYLGAEYVFLNIFAIRSGTEQIINSIDDEKYNFGVGLMYSFSGIKIFANYAYVIENLGNTSRFSLGIKLK